MWLPTAIVRIDGMRPSFRRS